MLFPGKYLTLQLAMVIQAIAAFFQAINNPVVAQDGVADEAKKKAAYIYGFTKYIRLDILEIIFLRNTRNPADNRLPKGKG